MLRPFVLFNAAVSLDGKLAPASRRKVRLGSDRDRARMDRLRAGSDAILIGAGTLRAEDPPLQVRSEKLRRLRRREGRPEHLLEIVVSATLDLPWRGRFFGPSRGEAPRRPPRLLVTTSDAPGRLEARAERLCETMRVGRGRVDLGRLLSRLRKDRGVERLLVEGGGGTFASFLERDLVDEIHLTVSPYVIGGAMAPTLFDGDGFDDPPFPRMKLALCRREGEEVYLRYERSAGGARSARRA